MKTWMRVSASLLISLCGACAEKSEDKAGFTNSDGMTFVRIPAGEFMMGSPEKEAGREDDEVWHSVTLSRPFYIQTTEVTRGQWKAIMGDDPSAFAECGDDCPVDRLKPEWAQFLIDKMNQKKDGYVYRLPTEAEWEYVARAGTSTAFATGNCLGKDKANYNTGMPYQDCPKSEPLRKPTPVKQYPPNAWGVYGMHGNAWELCSDWYAPYDTKATTDPKGPETGTFKVIRGGSWGFPETFARSANRFKTIQDITGFRLVAVPKAPQIEKP